MGPQPNSCGNNLTPHPVIVFASSFNGATAKQLWKQTPLYGDLYFCDGFNGATAKQLWKRGIDGGVDQESVELQWGHSQTAVETRSGVSVEGVGKQLQWGHSQTAVETSASVGCRDWYFSRFNGATAKQLWKPLYGPRSPRVRQASMGPQPNSCGNTPCAPACRAAAESFNGATAKQLWKREPA